MTSTNNFYPDIDECQLRMDICIREIQYCINTPGGFDCQSKKEFQKYNCPAGYKFNNLSLNCDGERVKIKSIIVP